MIYLRKFLTFATPGVSNWTRISGVKREFTEEEFFVETVMTACSGVEPWSQEDAEDKIKNSEEP